jgi:nitroimidazol reductase NimA-like FMN-containing flavoprotein (pyridoxamine 5'-phosphate oxidase superfamily)
MLIRELTAEDCQALLQRTNLGRLACVRHNRPYIVPIYFDFFEDALYSFATVGKKIRWMRTNPRVCVEIDDIIDQFNWTTVVVEGRYEELTKTPAHAATRKRAYQLFANRPDWWYPAAGKTRATSVETPVIYRIEIEGLSGRRAARDHAKTMRIQGGASAKAPRWWSNVLRPLQGPPRAFK